MRGSILLLLLIGVEGAPSKGVQDLCRDEARSTTTVREDVIVAIRGGGFRRRPGQAMIHPCCPSDEDARRVFMSVLTFINKLKTYGFGDTRVLGTTYGCPAGDAQYTKELQEWYEPYLKQSSDWTMLSHGSKAHDKHRQKSGAQGLWTQSKFVVSELQARLRPVEAAAPPRLLVELRADEMIAVRNWTLFRECLDEGPAGDVVPGEYARCYTHWDDLPDAPSVIRPCGSSSSWGRSVRRAPRISFEGRSGARASPTTPSRTTRGCTARQVRINFLTSHFTPPEQVPEPSY